MTDHTEAELALRVCEQMYSQLIDEGRTPPQWLLDYRAALHRLVEGEKLPLPAVPEMITAWTKGGSIH